MRCLSAALAACGLMASAVSAAPVRIMCLGDSLTAGYTNAPTWTVPFTFGYRGPLYTRLTNASYSFLYVGASGEPWNLSYGAAFGSPASIQGPDLRALSQDNHRGYGGASTSQLLNGGHAGGSTNTCPAIADMLSADNPDVILLMIGTNNYSSSSAQGDLNSLVSKIVATKPDAKLIVAQIPPRSTYQQSLVDYNSYIRNTLVPHYAGLGKHVTTVDQYVNLLTNVSNLTSIDTSLFTDSAHPMPTANERLSRTWLTSIQAVVSAPEPDSLSLLAGAGLLLAARTCWRARRRARQW